MVRSFCGTNEHPDPTMFLLIFRLMSIYSLVRVEGSNVADEEIFDTLIMDSMLPETCESKEKWVQMRDSIVQRFKAPSISDTSRSPLIQSEDDGILEFLCGCIASKAISFITCNECASTLIVNPSRCSDTSKNFTKSTRQKSLIDFRDFFNVLHHPSQSLFNFVSILEKIISEEIVEHKLTPKTFFAVSDKVNAVDFSNTMAVGCPNHYTEVLGYILQYYLVLRMHISTKLYNATIKDIDKHKQLRKMGKLTQGNKVANLSASEAKLQAKVLHRIRCYFRNY